MLFDFQCQNCNLLFEELVKSSKKKAPCPKCQATAIRQISTPRIDRSAIALTKGASPESIAHFDRIHRERKAIEERTHAEHGDYGKSAGAD
jgi:putative FmdB family regulatory protein